MAPYPKPSRMSCEKGGSLCAASFRPVRDDGQVIELWLQLEMQLKLAHSHRNVQLLVSRGVMFGP